MSNEHHDERFVQRVRQAWGRPELSATERAELTSRVSERTRQRTLLFSHKLAVATVAVLAIGASVVLWVGRDSDTVAADWLDPLVAAQAVLDGEEETDEPAGWIDWLGSVEAGDPDTQLVAMLDPEYQALAYWLEPAEELLQDAEQSSVP